MSVRLSDEQANRVVWLRDRTSEFLQEIASSVRCSAEGTVRQTTCSRCHGSGETSDFYGDTVFCPPSVTHKGSCLSAPGARDIDMCSACRAYHHFKCAMFALQGVLHESAKAEEQAKREVDEKRESLAASERDLVRRRAELEDAVRRHDELVASAAERQPALQSSEPCRHPNIRGNDVSYCPDCGERG